MMDKADVYRHYALEAQEQADRATFEADKAAWLRIAHTWLVLMAQYRQTHPTAAQKFDAEADRHGTGQEKSGTSH